VQLKLKTKCEFCGKVHWDWYHNKFSQSGSKIAMMSHNELLSAIIRESEKNMIEHTDYDAVLCSLHHNLFVLSNSDASNSWLHKRNIGIFKELIALLEKRDRMEYIARCEELQKELYEKHLEEQEAKT